MKKFFSFFVFLSFGLLASPAKTDPPTITLEEAQKMADQFNPSLKNIDETIFQAGIMIQSAWSMLLPNLSANASLTRNQHEVAIEFPDFEAPPGPDGEPQVSELVIQELWGQSASVSANMTLFNPRSIPAIKMAYDSFDKTLLKAQTDKNNLLFAVTSMYYQAHSMDEMIQVAKENLKMAEQFLHQSESLKKAGQSTQIDVLRAEIEVVDAKKALANYEDAYSMSKTSLAYLIGAEGDFSIANPKQVSPVESDLDGLTKKALGSRVELKEAELSRVMSRRSKNESLMKWLPSFDVTYTWSWNSAAGFSGDNDVWMLIFGANWKLFEGGARIAEYKSRKSEMRMADNNLTQLSLNIRQEVDQGYQALRKRKRNLELVQKQLELAQKNHYLINRQYEVGLVSSLDVLSATTDLAGKRRSQVLEQLQYDLAVLTLKKAVGEYHALAQTPKK